MKSANRIKSLLCNLVYYLEVNPEAPLNSEERGITSTKRPASLVGVWEMPSTGIWNHHEFPDKLHSSFSLQVLVWTGVCRLLPAKPCLIFLIRWVADVLITRSCQFQSSVGAGHCLNMHDPLCLVTLITIGTRQEWLVLVSCPLFGLRSLAGSH